MNDDRTTEQINPEKFVKENRDSIIAVIRASDDPFTRACAWALLDKHTSDTDIDELHEELDSIAEQNKSR